MWLFGEDRRDAVLSGIRDLLESCEIASLTPLEALNLLARLIEKARQ